MTGPEAGAASSSPGARLRRAREGRGWTAAHAAELMRLPADVVQSLEADRYGDLGAPVFARGHLRRYARLLDVPDGPLLDAYDRSHAGPAAPTLIPQASAHTPVREAGAGLRLPAAAWYALGAAVVAAAGAGGYWWWNQRRVAEEPPPVSAPRDAAAAQPQPSAESAPVDPLSEDLAGAAPGATLPEAAPPAVAGEQAP